MGIVTALLLLATTQGARSEMTLEHLLAIDGFLSTNDTQSLYSYLQRNPDLLLGNDELSVELQNFYEAASAGNLDFDYAASGARNPDDTANETTFQH